MEVYGTINGSPIQRDVYDLDYIHIDVIRDFVRSIEEVETNPEAKIEVDLTYPENPDYRLFNCSTEFKEQFHKLINQRQAV
jgi:hypothetical protein